MRSNFKAATALWCALKNIILIDHKDEDSDVTKNRRQKESTLLLSINIIEDYGGFKVQSINSPELQVWKRGEKACANRLEQRLKNNRYKKEGKGVEDGG